MNFSKKHLTLGLFYAAAVLYAGCLPLESLKWSDDGSVGLLSVKEGLYVVDGESGELKQIAEGYVVPWPDISGNGKTIVYLQVKTAADFDEGLMLLDAAEVKMIEDSATRVASAIAGKGGIEAMAAPEKKALSSQYFGRWVSRYVCEKGPEEALVILGPEWVQQARDAELPYCEILITDADGKETRLVARSVLEIVDLRLSPDAENVAYIGGDPEKDDINGFNLFVASVKGNIKKMLVGERVAILGHDWRADGRAIAYASVLPADYTGDDLPLPGGLFERVVTNEDRSLLAGEETKLASVVCQSRPDKLADILFFPFSRVQYGQGGRLFFASGDFKLPKVATEDEPQWSVYCYDAAFKTVSNVLPQQITSQVSGFDSKSPAIFSLSPDGRKVLLVMENNRFAIYEPGAGLESLKIPMKADEGFEDGLQFLPAWKGSGEVSFIVSDKSHFDIGEAAKAIGVLDQYGSFSVLSKDWPQFELLK